MISVRNHRPPLSGNKWLVILGVALFAWACSPKIRPIAPPVKPPVVEKPVVVTPPKPVEKPVVKPPARTSVIALILPFGLDHLSPASAYTDVTLKQADLALDYYQGFKMALDSLTAQGYNYKLQLFDSKDVPAQARALALNPQVKASDLIVGPVFPDDIKAFTALLTAPRKPIVSPLAPSEPSLFKNPNLITVVPPLDCHAWAAAEYITKTIRPKKLFVLRSGYSDEINYLTPFKKGIDSLGKKQIIVNQATIVHGNLAAIIPQLSLTQQNVFVIAATDAAFLNVTLKTLDSLSDKYPIILFGHPSWEKFTFLKAELLQRLNTHITISDKIDYKSPSIMAFMRDYRKVYNVEATDYAIKGFDEGMYFGKQLGVNSGDVKNLDKNSFTGLHNNFNFTGRPGLGWVNTHVTLYQYINFELKPVE